MKTKLLTICLLLFTSQVFAKNYSEYLCCQLVGDLEKGYTKVCPAAADRYAENCNTKKCEKTKYWKVQFKINIAQQKVLMNRGNKIIRLGDCDVIDKENWACVKETKLGSVGSLWLHTEMKDGIYSFITRNVDYKVMGATCGK